MNTPAPPTHSGTLRWLLLVAGCTLLWTLAAVWAPAPVRKIGLFSCVLGAAVVWTGLTLLRSLAVPPARWQIALLVLAAGLAEVGRTAESYRIYRNHEAAAIEKELDELPGFLPELREQIATERQIELTDYLAHRYSALSVSPESSLCWSLLVGEIVLAAAGGAAAVFVFRRQNR
ncbi:hypothetical protein [Rubinisphaera margarita]|uniref:hypothetical protein n=1 Tax=Rubinisphaera margarita TaxID=2909586 RepID=UPI001EE891D5|nr:hypothetical protein [Rubinisphaera margarita]MCG6155245.1 hypothetical protein [Rubinisphaera margarita]